MQRIKVFFDIVELLLENGANSNIETKMGNK
jgi:hypothetical protein